MISFRVLSLLSAGCQPEEREEAPCLSDDSLMNPEAAEHWKWTLTIYLFQQEGGRNGPPVGPIRKG